MKRRDVFASAPLLLLVVGALAFWNSETGRAMTGRWSYSKGVEIDPGVFYRLKFDLTYEGEPQIFDIVVGCSVRRESFADGSASTETGIRPVVYGRKMKSGHALVVRTPDACNGATSANGWVPPDFIPLLVDYADAERLDFGVAYLTEDAFASPYSKINFGKATVQTATKEEYDAFRTNGPPNIITPGKYHSVRPEELERYGVAEGEWPPFARLCYAVARFKIPDGMRDALARYRPQDKPRYWMLNDRDGLYRLVSGGIQGKGTRDDGADASSYAGFVVFGETPGWGILHTYGGGFIYPKEQPSMAAPSVFPFSTALSDDKWTSAPYSGAPIPSKEAITATLKIQFDQGRYRGFGYCWMTSFAKLESFWGYDVHSERERVTFDGKPVAAQGRQSNFSLDPPMLNWAFEDISHVYIPTMIDMVSWNGGP